MQEEIAKINSERSKFEDDLRKEMTAEKEALLVMIEELKGKIITNEEALKENDRKAYIIESEFEKERALLQQKIQYYEKLIEEMNRKERVTYFHIWTKGLIFRYILIGNLKRAKEFKERARFSDQRAYL